MILAAKKLKNKNENKGIKMIQIQQINWKVQLKSFKIKRFIQMRMNFHQENAKRAEKEKETKIKT